MPHVTPLIALATAGLVAASPSAAQQRDSAATAAILIGRVVDGEGCGRLRGATVQLLGSTRSTTTDTAGRFRFAEVRPGRYSVVAASALFASDTAHAVEVATPLGYAELRLRSEWDARSGVPAPDDSVPAGDVSTIPSRPRAGSLFRVRVTRGEGTSIGPSGIVRDSVVGTFAGEPLHFGQTGPGVFEALAAVPVDARETLRLAVRRVHNGDRIVRDIPIAPGDFPIERLRVAPEFGREPDLALAERLERESEKARDVGCRAHATPRLWTRPFVRPRPGRVTSTFGRAREYNGTVTGRHSGTDFAGATGAPVRAANRGVVRLVARFYLGGNVVYVDHGEGLVSAYLHLSRTDVAVGDTVARGQVIGGVGSTGRVTGPHLHWVVRYGRTSVDPMSLLAVAGAPSEGAKSQEPRAKRD